MNLGMDAAGADSSIKKITLSGNTENDFPSRNNREIAFLLFSFSDLPKESNDIYSMFTHHAAGLQNYLTLLSSETVSLALPLALLRASSLRPFLLAILDLKPCLLDLFLLEGWNVLFISYKLNTVIRPYF